ncbi:solute carrier family 2, facilitated glucose transporter member 11-like [Carcharodon carcharias]|uniref:solute carrier family 2, facilitated glucose transporter member 11-like n=1 Tax=Carcharodon carcharias TaxID=13397 RepID=UPI001B7F4433|nr:solute carrier family 2, facilitated glucose transporter member 11-like [Carcharodon carcharias]
MQAQQGGITAFMQLTAIGDEEVAKSMFSVRSGATVNTGSEWHQHFSCFTRLGSSAAANPVWQVQKGLCHISKDVKMAKKLSALRRRRFILVLFVAGIGGSFQFGFSISSINPPSEYIKNFINETWIERHEKPLQEYSLMLLWSFIVSVYPVGGLVGAQIAAIITVKYGRKKSLLCNDIVAIMAAIIMGFSKMARSFEMIVIGRFLHGINTGIGLVAHGLYLGEIAPKEVRGAVCMTRAVFVAFGKLIGLVVGLRQILGDENTWHLLLAFCGLPALIQLITLPWFPESPRYLLLERGDQALCIDALRRLWGPGDFTEEVEDMNAERAQMQGGSKMYIIQLFRDKTIRYQFFTAMVISAGMQLTGINIIYFYASDVYHQLEIPKDRIPFVGIGSSGIEMLTSVMCGFIIERVGRKVLLWRGYCFMAVCLLLLIITLSLKEHFSWIPYCSLVIIFAYILTFGIGPGSISGVLPLEIFTQSNRSIALVTSNSLQWLSLFGLGLVFPFVINALGQFSFFLFVGGCCLASLFTFYVLPETKGKTLLQINEEFNNLRNAKKGICPIFSKRPVVPKQTEILSTRL